MRTAAVLVSGILLLMLEIALSAIPGAQEGWRPWSPIATAHAYKVERICEEKQTKTGIVRKCKSLLVQENPGDKKAAQAGDKGDKGGKKDAHAKEAPPKDAHSSAPAKH